MPHEFRLIRRVEFAETDMAGIMHFANFFRFMEAAEHAFLRSLGVSVHMELDGRTIGWPRVRVACDYKRPLRFEDEVEAHLMVREKREKSLAYEFIFHRVEEPAQEVARGSFTVVCVSMDAQSGKMKAVPIPDVIAQHIEVAPEADSGGDIVSG
ncbi:MAG TPA: thioesterase family protein [Armatimonadota bacterium]|nr:thioesterase family protein [Armatimonadota bacterium]